MKVNIHFLQVLKKGVELHNKHSYNSNIKLITKKVIFKFSEIFFPIRIRYSVSG